MVHGDEYDGCGLQDHGMELALDAELIRRAAAALPDDSETPRPVTIESAVVNVNRAVGTQLSHEVCCRVCLPAILGAVPGWSCIHAATCPSLCAASRRNAWQVQVALPSCGDHMPGRRQKMQQAGSSIITCVLGSCCAGALLACHCLPVSRQRCSNMTC